MAALFHQVLLIQCLVCSGSLFPVPLCGWILNAISARLHVKNSVIFHPLLLLMLLRDDKCPGALPEGSVLTWGMQRHLLGVAGGGTRSVHRVGSRVQDGFSHCSGNNWAVFCPHPCFSTSQYLVSSMLLQVRCQGPAR